MAEASEIKGSESHAPRSVQPVTMFETLQELASGTINIHKTQAGAVGFKLRTFLVERISDDNVIADCLHVERDVAVWQALIHERIILRGLAIAIGGVLVEVFLGQLHNVKRIVINIHTTFVEVCRVQKGLAIDEGAGQPRVAGSIGGFDHNHSKRRSHSWIPSRNRSIIRGEEENGWLAWGQQKVCLTAVEDSASWCTRWGLLVSRIGRRNGDALGRFG